MTKEKKTLKALIEKNKQELLKDRLAVERIEQRVEKRIQQHVK
ncbi:FbpB family small basic protein [Bacillus sp. V3B]|nr:FbpB family small basic protein [Bacillus sp. V3B]MCQ6275637.1 FbpB family small basic protein [Bacillus sp. V3B]